jgi:hypothetical protein
MHCSETHQIYECIITHQDGNRNLCPHALLKVRRTFLKPFSIVEINGEPWQWRAFFVNRFGFGNAPKGSVAA